MWVKRLEGTRHTSSRTKTVAARYKRTVPRFSPSVQSSQNGRNKSSYGRSVDEAYASKVKTEADASGT